MTDEIHRPTAHEMETASGLYVDLLDPNPEMIALEDIADHLSRICRFTGACLWFYSVAQHAMLVVDRVAETCPDWHPEVALAALHHDSAEAYLGDVGTPLKRLLGKEYDRLSNQMDNAIAEALGITIYHPQHLAIEAADAWALAAEAHYMMRSEGFGWPGEELFEPNGDKLGFWRIVGRNKADEETPMEVAERFVDTHHLLKEQAEAVGR